MRHFGPGFAIVVGSTWCLVLAACSRSGPPESLAQASSATAAAASASASAKPPETFPVAKASVDAVLNPMNVPEYKGPTGSVEGTISVVGPPAPPVPLAADTSKCPAAIDTYGKLFREGTPATPNGPRALADAVVVATGWGNGFFIPDKKDAVHLTVGPNCAYPSRTIAITYGQRIEVSNQSDLLFAPLIDQDPMPAVMVAPPREAGDPVKLYPERAGFFTMSDRMQPFVKEDLYVFRHPLHAVSDRDGHYRIDGIPVGKVTIGAADAELNAKEHTTVEIKENVVARADLTLTYKPPAPGGPANRAPDGGIIPPWRMPNE